MPIPEVKSDISPILTPPQAKTSKPLAGRKITPLSSDTKHDAKRIRDTLRNSINASPKDTERMLQELRPSITALSQSLKQAQGARNPLNAKKFPLTEDQALIQEAIYETKLFLCNAAKDSDKNEHVLTLLPLIGASEAKISKLMKQFSKESEKKSQAEIQKEHQTKIQKKFKTEIQKSIKDLLYQGLPALEYALEYALKSAEEKENLPPITDVEKKQIEQLLELALGNKELNRYLYRKKKLTKGEEFLSKLSYLTLDLNATSIAETTTQVTNTLHEHNIDMLLEINKSYDELERKVLETKIGIDVSQLHTAESLPIAEQRFSETRLNILFDIQKQIERVKLAENVNIDEQLETLNNQINELILLTAEAIQITKDCEEKCENAEFKHPFLWQDARSLAHSEKLSELLAKLQFPPSPGGKLEMLRQASSAATQILSTLNKASYLLPNYRAGDIVFDEEALTAAYKGTKGPLFSELHVPQNIPTFIQALRKKGVWAIEPYFTGHLTHASIIEITKSEPYSVEVDTEYSRKRSGIHLELIRTGYRPNLEALLTPEALKALTEAHISIPEIEKIYAEQVAEFRDLHSVEFKTLRNSALRGAIAILLAKLDKLMSKVKAKKQSAVSIPNFLIPGYIKSTHRMFCSEFVSNFLRAVQTNTETAIKAKLRDPNIKIFEDVIPSNVAPKAIPPARLESILMENGYKQIKSPLLTRLLFNTNAPPQKPVRDTK